MQWVLGALSLGVKRPGQRQESMKTVLIRITEVRKGNVHKKTTLIMATVDWEVGNSPY
jgi:hypothetical protein